MYESCIKRLLDLILSLAACVVLAIPMGIIALWIKKDSPLATTPFCIGPINIPHAVSLYYIRICRAMQVGKRQNRQKNEL